MSVSPTGRQRVGALSQLLAQHEVSSMDAEMVGMTTPHLLLTYMRIRSGLTPKAIALKLGEIGIGISPSGVQRMFSTDVQFAWRTVSQTAQILGAEPLEMDMLRSVWEGQRARLKLAAGKTVRGREPDPIECSTSAEFIEKLNDVLVWAGEPSLRQLADASGGLLRRSTIGDMLNGSNLPRENTMVRFLEVCGITDIATWTVTWRRLRIKQRKRAAALRNLPPLSERLL
ncbi:hypothetical protein ACIOC1_34290 [Streptomyces sp. NPDC088197]|uniref:hypothetical protein n=1 Tax=unclassified Streptomyces TaxID=2593676 RepID=UPI0036E33DEB